MKSLSSTLSLCYVITGGREQSVRYGAGGGAKLPPAAAPIFNLFSVSAALARCYGALFTYSPSFASSPDRFSSKASRTASYLALSGTSKQLIINCRTPIQYRCGDAYEIVRFLAYLVAE